MAKGHCTIGATAALAAALATSVASAQPAPDLAAIRAEVQSQVPRLGSGGEARLASVRVFTTDLDRAIRFYQDVFGLKLIHRMPNGEAAFSFPNAGPPGLVLAKVAVPHGNGGFAIAVADADVVAARVVVAGGKVERPATNIPAVALRILIVTDPDGANIEVVQRLAPG